MPRFRSLFAGLAEMLGRASAAAGIASAITAARQTMYPIRILTQVLSARRAKPEVLGKNGWTLCGNRVQRVPETGCGSVPEQGVLGRFELRIGLQELIRRVAC